MLNIIFNYFLLKENVYASREVLDELRFTLLKKQLMHAYLNIPYYKKAFDKSDVHPEKLKTIYDLTSYPIITKDIVRSHHSELINQKAILRNNFKSHTSGSTGQPMWTYYDMKSWIRKKYLIKARARMECGVKSNERIAIFESTSSEQTDQRNKSFLSRTILSQVKVFSIFEPFEQTIKKLYSYSPHTLYGSPSYFFQIAQIMGKNNFNIPSIKRIFTSSEYLQENIRNYIGKIFNANVYDIYGSTEFKEAAWECDKHEGYHINEDEVIVEVVQNGKPVPHGVIGNIVITDLRNKAMPLIRYQMYDKGMLIEEKCSCGRTFALMKPYAGRSSEYIILPNEEILSPYFFTTNIEKINGLIQYQVVQTTKEKIVVSIVTNSEDFNRIATAIKSILTNITNHLMEIEVQQNTKIDIEENGKFKVVKNLILERKEIKI
jgi:phenylacetate-CoA ligase